MMQVVNSGIPVPRASQEPASGPLHSRRAGNYRDPSAGLWRVALIVICFVPTSWASGMEPPESIEAGRKALSEHTDYPWYDPDEDGLRRIDVKTPRESAINRDSMWQADPASSRDYSWLESLMRGLGIALRVVAWLGLAILLILLCILLARAFVMREERVIETQDTETVSSQIDADRIENLPFQVRLPQADLLAEAGRCYERGDYGQAIVYLFSYKLLALDRHDLIRLTRGKTNRQYLAELRYQPTLREILGRTMVAFEDVFFGHHKLERDRFETCWGRLDDFHQQLQQVAAS